MESSAKNDEIGITVLASIIQPNELPLRTIFFFLRCFLYPPRLGPIPNGEINFYTSSARIFIGFSENFPTMTAYEARFRSGSGSTARIMIIASHSPRAAAAEAVAS